MLTTSIIGNIGRNAEVREVNGSLAVNFSVAHNERIVTRDGEVINKTIWINCTQWIKKKTELFKYLTKGTLVFVEGKPEMKGYTDDKGKAAVDFRLRVGKIELLSSPKEESQKAEALRTAEKTTTAENAAKDNLDDVWGENAAA